jgi:L-cysteine S-thiosulfotransferase
MQKSSILAGLLIAASFAPAAAQQVAIDAAVVDRYIAGTFKGASEEWRKRIEPDEAQRLCSGATVKLAPDQEKKLIESAKAGVQYPADGNVLGDWKKGQQLAQRGTGGQFSDQPGGPIGGNCYACHQLSKAELSFGTIGPSLNAYGKTRKFKPEDAKEAYAKIWNAQVVQPCSNMPRFGHNKFLSIEQIKDLTAYLFDPDSPVNK